MSNIALFKNTIDKNGKSIVSARELYKFLEVETQFTIWCTRMFKYGFKEDIHYTTLTQKKVTAQGNESTFKDYALTLNCAKEIAMLQRSDKGKQARQYFISQEKALSEYDPKKDRSNYIEALTARIEEIRIKKRSQNDIKYE